MVSALYHVCTLQSKKTLSPHCHMPSSCPTHSTRLEFDQDSDPAQECRAREGCPCRLYIYFSRVRTTGKRDFFDLIYSLASLSFIVVSCRYHTLWCLSLFYYKPIRRPQWLCLSYTERSGIPWTRVDVWERVSQWPSVCACACVCMCVFRCSVESICLKCVQLGSGGHLGRWHPSSLPPSSSKGFSVQWSPPLSKY